MRQEIEIEFKTLLTAADFSTIQAALPFPKEAHKQVNYYLETKDFQLKKQRSALRIREKKDAFTLTLKQPHTEGILETHESLTKEECAAFLANDIIEKPYIQQALQDLGIAMQDLQYCGALTTYRRSFTEDNIEYVLDESHYSKVVDYELEIEAPSYDKGQAAFHRLLKENGIRQQASITKIERFFQAIQEA